MDFRYTPEQEAFRNEFSSWLKKNLADFRDTSEPRRFESQEEFHTTYRAFQKRLYDAGYAAMHYPKEYGGQGKSIIEEIIVQQELYYNCAELKSPGAITFGMAAPTILTCGNEEQKKKYLPKIIDGTHIWCQGFSEPNAGSDVANVSTTAVRKGDHYILNGQKVWTTFAHFADFCILLVRTDPSTTKHRGLSYLLVDMKSPGVEVRPIKQITGEAEFNDMFFEDVKVPVEMLVQEEGAGWRIAITTLMFERVLGDATVAYTFKKNLEILFKMAKETKRAGKPVIEDPIYRQQLGQAYIETTVMKYHGLRNLSKQLQGGVPGPEGSIGKILWSEPNQRISANAVGMQGLNGQIIGGSPWAVQDGHWQYAYLRALANTIEAGSSEIQRNIIGERVLNLPKDSSRAERRKGE